jgi:tetratricopeptide (TPR) repeat protein
MRAVKRALVSMAFLAVAAVAAAIVYQSEARERDYRHLLAQGEAALAEGQTSAAIEDYSGAIALRPDSMLAYLRRGETYRSRGELDDAARDFRTAATLDPTATRPLEQWGDVLYAQQRYRRSAEVYQSRLALDDRSAVVRYRLGLALYRNGEHAAAIRSLTQATALDNQLSDAFYVMALCYREQGQLEEAVDALKNAVSRSPGSIPAREELADLYRVLNQPAQELEQLQVLAGLDTGRVDRQIAIGLAYARTGHADLGLLTLENALEQWPNHPSIYTALGRVWLNVAETSSDRPDALARALDALARAAATANATSDVKMLYGRALAADGQLEAAERVLQQATERFPAAPEAFATYASVAEQLKHPDQARAALLSYHALVGENADFAGRALKLGLLSLELSDDAAARSWLERASTMLPENVALWKALAEADVRLDDPDAARTAVARGLALDPADRALRTLARRVGAPLPAATAQPGAAAAASPAAALPSPAVAPPTQF